MIPAEPINMNDGPAVDWTDAAIAAEAVKIADRIAALMAKVRYGTDQQLAPVAQAVGVIIGKISQCLELHCDHAKQVQAKIEAKISADLDRRIEIAKGTIQLLNAKIAKAEKRLQGKRKKAPVIAQQITPMQQEPTPCMPGVDEIFPAPPKKAELAGLVVALVDDKGAVQLDQLPANYWHLAPHGGWWLSLSMTPLSRVQIRTFKVLEDAVEPGGMIFLNIGSEMDQQTLTALLGTLQIAPEAYLALTQSEAWDAAVGIFGDYLTGNVWDVYQIPHPAVAPTLKPPEACPPGHQLPAPEAFPGVEMPPEGFPVVAEVQQRPGIQLPPIPGVQLPAIPADLMTILRWLATRHWPTNQEVCTFLDPFYAFINIPAEARVPCVSLDAFARFVMAKVPAGGVDP